MTHFAATRHVRAGSCLLLILVLLGCNSSPSPEPATPEPVASAGVSPGPISTVAPAPTEAGEILLPPGAQYASGPTSIPGQAEPVVTQFLTRAYFFAQKDGHPEALYRDGSVWVPAVIDVGKGYKAPAGSALIGDDYFRVVGAAANDTAMVVLGSALSRDRDRPSGLAELPEGMIWVTRDARTFDRVDPRNVVPDAASFRLVDVAVTTKGFVIVGTALPKALDGPGFIVVLTSPDGATWSLAARIDGDGTLAARQLLVDGEGLLIDAVDQRCDAKAISYRYGLRTGVTRAWASGDNGSTWLEVDLAAAEPVLHQPAEADGDCPLDAKLGDLIALSQQLDTQGRIVGMAKGALIARSKDAATVGVSTDLTSWSQVALPEAIPAAADARRPYAQQLVRESGGAMSLVVLEDRADAEGRPRSGGCQVRWWRSTDAGATWSTGPWGRPFSTCVGATYDFDQLLDGSVVLFIDVIMSNLNQGEASFRTATAGALIPWATCTPGPDVDCSFATIVKPTSEAPDWPGINLSGATITDAAIPGVKMPKADAYAALLSGTFGAANLHEAVLSYAIIEGDFRGADFGGAYLFHTIIRADLTGATVDGAELTGATFEAGSVCPDGEAPAPGATDAKAACRL